MPNRVIKRAIPFTVFNPANPKDAKALAVLGLDPSLLTGKISVAGMKAKIFKRKEHKK